MAKMQFYTPWGIIKEAKNKMLGHHNFNDIIKKILRSLFVPYVDLCCDETTPGDTAPVRFNTTEGEFQYHDGEDWVAADAPTEVASLSGAVRYNIDDEVLEYYNGTAWVDVPAIV